MMMNDRYLNKLPLASLLLELDTSFLVKRHSTSVDDGSGKDAKCQLDSGCSLQKTYTALIVGNPLPSKSDALARPAETSRAASINFSRET